MNLSLSPSLAALAAAVLVFAPGPGGGSFRPENDRAVKAVDEMVRNAAVDKSKPSWRGALPRPRVVRFDPARRYFARMATNRGTLRIRLMPDLAPMHVTSFLYLTRLGFYDGLKFHRVIPGFMAQGGCPWGNGTGGPGYEFGAEVSPKARHDKAGVLSTANRGPNTDGSQFFLTFAPAPQLDGDYTVFGQVTEGQEALLGLEVAGTPSGRPTALLLIEKVTVEVE